MGAVADIVRLDAVPELADAIADRYHAEWSRDPSPEAQERMRREVRESLDESALPITRVAVLDGALAGAAQLKIREMARYPDFEWWLGGVFVAPAHRGAGLASRLVRACIHEAGRRALPRLHLQTERADGGLYARLGWRTVERVIDDGLEKTIMVREVGDGA